MGLFKRVKNHSANEPTLDRKRELQNQIDEENKRLTELRSQSDMLKRQYESGRKDPVIATEAQVVGRKIKATEEKIELLSAELNNISE